MSKFLTRPEFKGGATVNGTEVINSSGTWVGNITSSPSGIALTDGHILVGNGSNVAADVALTGDISITNAGVAAIASDSIVNADIKTTAAIAYSKLALTDSVLNADINSSAAIDWSKMAAVTAANIILGSAGNVATVTPLTGDVSITNAGLTTVTDLTITGEAQGDVLYRNATNWVRLAAGTAGQALITSGAGSNPYWGAPSVALASKLSNPFDIEGGTNDITVNVTTQTVGAPSLTIPDFANVDDTFCFLTLEQTFVGAKTFPNTGLHILDTNASHDLIIIPGSDLTADRNFTITTGDAARTLTMAGNITTANDFITAGNFSLTLTTTAGTDVTLPTTGTLATLAGTESLSGKTLTTPKILTTDYIADGGGDELLYFVESATPVNYVQVQNADTLNPAIIRANGSDGNVDLKLYGKASGCVYVADGTDPTKDLYFNVAGATANKTMQIVSSHTDDKALTLPDATDTLVGKATTDVFTNKSYDCNGTGNVLTNVDCTELDSKAIPATETGVTSIPFILWGHVSNEVAAVKLTDSMPVKAMLVRAWSQNTSGDGGTWKIQDNGSNDVTDVVTAAASDKDIDNASQIDDDYSTISAGHDVYINASNTLDAYIFCEFVAVD